jgi:hypothetical protein
MEKQFTYSIWFHHDHLIKINSETRPKSPNMTDLHADAVELAHPNRMQERLQAGEVVSAMSIRYSRGIEIVGYAKAAGMNGVLIDLEHRYTFISLPNLPCT